MGGRGGGSVGGRGGGSVTSAITSSEMHLDRASICQNTAASAAASLMATDVSEGGGEQTREGGRLIGDLHTHTHTYGEGTTHKLYRNTCPKYTITHTHLQTCVHKCAQTHVRAYTTKHTPALKSSLTELLVHKPPHFYKVAL